MRNQKSKSKIQNGIALVAVLAILVVLAIMAASFVTLMNIESKQSKVSINSQQLDMLIDSGLEYAKALITVEEMGEKKDDKVLDIANTFSQSGLEESKSKWMLVKDTTGKTIGRYRIRIEDEAGKVNIQKAFLLKNSKGTGWDTGEINLPFALDVQPKIAKKLVDYRYGKNKLPGGRGDDDQNNLVLMADGIDNDADGIIDEDDEGINDPKEYNAKHLNGDDRKFSSMSELMNILIHAENKMSPKTQSQMMSEIPRRATIYSCDMPGSPTLPNKIPSEINTITARECRKILLKANATLPFEPNSSKQMQLAANLVDYRDENHVLSTLGSTYGVEAICFNEILANDETCCFDPSYAFAPWLDNDKNYWIDNCGSADGKRMFYFVDMIYDALPDDPQSSYIIDPRRAWRINKKKKIGSLKTGGKVIITFPKTIGKYGRATKITPLIRSPLPVSLPGNKSWCKWQTPGAVIGSSSSLESLHRNLLEVLGKLGKKDGERPDFPKNYFKNSLAMIYQWSDNFGDSKTQHSIGCFKILSGNQKSITIDKNEYYSGETFDHRMALAGMTNDYDLSVTINSWSPGYPIACVDRANRTYLLRPRRPIAGKYFKIIIGRPGKGRYTKGYPDELGVSGNINGKYTSDKDLTRQWVCNDNKPIRTQSGGWIQIMLTSSPEVKRQGDNKQYVSYFRMMAPEVIEMYNASATPVSLANWRVICNTGSLATQIGRIRSTSYYDQKLRRAIVDDNPVVQPRGHFYLVNDEELFDANYGNADNKWGSSADEQIPVFQMDEQNWGVTYKIKSTRYSYGEGPSHNRWGYSIMVDEKGLDKEIFNLETIKFVDKPNADDPDSWNNLFAPVLSHFIYKENEIFIRPIGNDKDIGNGKLVGKSIMILGLPHSGGIVSLTLKNEYDQVCARTVDYGKVEVDELDVTTEKIDPTKNTWVKRQKPSIGGTENKAENRAMRNHHNDKFFIKNGSFGSVGEVRNISTGNNFERLGGKDVSKGVSALAALSRYMSSSVIRLESCLGDVTRIGWKQAYNEVAKSSLRSVQAKSGNWKPDKWVGHTLRFLSGPLRGEKYPVISNSKNTLILSEKNTGDIPRSSPNRKALKPNIGDKFSIGPGYATPMCYTRKSGDSATWTWKNVIPYSGTYDLYIYGLNDAIDTTEFLEENNNASLDIELWNYKAKKYDMLKKRGKYGKQDSFNAGKIKPENISDGGNIKIRLTSHNVVERNTDDKTGKAIVGSGGKQTGTAWFNYAVIAPVPVPGRININTAKPRLLASLPGINAKLARNIYEGLDRNGKRKLKPYQNIGDMLKIKGITPDVFAKCVNILAVDSTSFTVEVEAQLLKDNIFKEKTKTSTDSVIATRIKRFIIDADRQENGNVKIHELEENSVR